MGAQEGERAAARQALPGAPPRGWPGGRTRKGPGGPGAGAWGRRPRAQDRRASNAPNRLWGLPPGRRGARTIVVYTDAKRPRNEYPRRIVSPTHGGACCGQKMKPIGKAHRDLGKFLYKRCSACGYTVRCFIGLDWRWIKARLTRVVRPRASLGSEPPLDTGIAYRWIR